jgi:hypothetical protein
MKQTTIGVLIFMVILGSLLITGCVSPKTTETTPTLTKITTLSDTKFLAAAPAEELQAEVVQFSEFGQSNDSTKIVFRGKLTSSANSYISIYCNKKLVTGTRTGTDGSFEAKAQAPDCRDGYDAYAETDVNGKKVQSEHLEVQGLSTYWHKSSSKRILGGSSSFSSVQPSTAGVPEFSTMTLGAAVALTLIGIIYLRKK